MRVHVLLLLTLSACQVDVECDRRIDAAHRDALRDAAACRWEPEALQEPECAGLDRRPLYTYHGVWCSASSLECLRATDAAYQTCFPQDSATP